jgi:hypothetical protein
LWDVVRDLDPAATGWEKFRNGPDGRRKLLAQLDDGDALPRIAAGMVRRAASLVGVELEGQALRSRVAFLLKRFGTPICFYNAIIRKVVDGGADMSKPLRANSIWDLQIAFCGLPGSTSDGVPVILVSNEQSILDAAADAGDPSAVITLDEFVESLG